MTLAKETLANLRRRLTSKEISPRDIVTDLASQIEANNPTIGAYLSKNLDAALAEADKADISKPLGGIPIAIKDNINVTGEPCTCASKILAEGYLSP